MSAIAPADIESALECLRSRQADYARYRDYYDGRHRLQFATDAFQAAFGSMFRTMAYNRARSVVDAYTNRLQVTGWESPGVKPKETGLLEEPPDDVLGNAAMVIWERTRMPKRQGELFAEAMRSGDAYLIVWPDDEGNARLDINRGHLIHPVYDDERPEQMLFAVKAWPVSMGEYREHWRVTVYEPDGITRWITKSKSQEMPRTWKVLIPYADDGEAETDNPWGVVPVFHLGNNADTGQCGTSELVDVIPLQDALNKNINDMLVVSEYAAYPQRYAVGVAPTINHQTNEEEEPFKPGVDRLWAVSDEAAKFGQFDPTDLGQFTNVQDAWDLKISRVSFVPVHWLSMSGTPPSGESLKTAEGPFVAKVLDRQTAFGDTLSAAMNLALRMEGAGEDAAVVPIWQSAETRSDLDMLQQAAMKKALGIPDEQIWAELGYSVGEIAEFSAINEAAAQKQQELFAQSFDRGQVPGGEDN